MAPISRSDAFAAEYAISGNAFKAGKAAGFSSGTNYCGGISYLGNPRIQREILRQAVPAVAAKLRSDWNISFEVVPASLAEKVQAEREARIRKAPGGTLPDPSEIEFITIGDTA